MTTQFHRESAKIYQFPTNHIRRSAFRSDVAPAVEFAASDICYEALENCWYHEEAVRQADEDRNGRPHA